MTLGAGAIALKRFMVLGMPSHLPFSQWAQWLHKERIHPLSLDDVREESLGWCHPYTGEPQLLDFHDHCYGNVFVFAMRKDVKKIPGTTLKLQLKMAVDSLEKSGDKSKSGKGAHSGKKLKEAVKDRLREELLAHTIPTVRMSELLWHADKSEIWLLSASSAVVSDFEELFQKTFEFQLISKNPGVFSFSEDTLGLKESKPKISALLDLMPTSAFGLLEEGHGAVSEPNPQPTELTANDLF